MRNLRNPLIRLICGLICGCGLISGCRGVESDEVSELASRLTQEAPINSQQSAVNSQQSTPRGTSGNSEFRTPNSAFDSLPTPNPELEAAFAAATETAVALEQTRVSAELTRVAGELLADEALAPIKQELAMLGVNPNQGELGFTHPPISLQVNDPDEHAFANRNALTVAQDFVIAADITWESSTGDSGCGFVVRSDGNEEAPSQYIISLTQSGEGHILFAEQVAGDIDFSDSTDIAAAAGDPLFNRQSGATNRLVVAGRGQEFTIYSNGTRLGAITGKSGFEEGFVAFVAVNKSGGIKCDFENAYLWKIN